MANVDISKEFYGKVEGQSAKLIYGKSLEYKVGASSSVAASAESKLKCGASNGVEMGLHGHFSFYDLKVDDHFGGAAFAIEHANRKSFKDVFAISAGAESKTLYWTLKLFAAGTILTQVGLAIAAGAHYNDKIKNAALDADGKWLNKKDEEDAMAVAMRLQVAMSAVAPMLALITGVILFLRKKSITDKLIDRSCSAFSITKNSKAFLGVRSPEGASGLVLRENLFSLVHLSADSFRKEGHEAIGFERTYEYNSDKQLAGIIGDKDVLSLKGGTVKVQSASAQGVHATIKAGEQTDVTTPGVSIHVDGDSKLLPIKGTPTIDIKSSSDVVIQGGKKSDTAGLIKLKKESISLKVGIKGIDIDGDKVNISVGIKDQHILMNSTGITIQHGGNNINFNAAGIQLAGNALRILNPSVSIPNFEAALQLKIESAEKVAKEVKGQTDEAIRKQTNTFEQKIKDLIDGIMRDVEAKIDSAIGK